MVIVALTHYITDFYRRITRSGNLTKKKPYCKYNTIRRRTVGVFITLFKTDIFESEITNLSKCNFSLCICSLTLKFRIENWPAIKKCFFSSVYRITIFSSMCEIDEPFLFSECMVCVTSNITVILVGGYSMASLPIIVYIYHNRLIKFPFRSLGFVNQLKILLHWISSIIIVVSHTCVRDRRTP